MPRTSEYTSDKLTIIKSLPSTAISFYFPVLFCNNNIPTISFTVDSVVRSRCHSTTYLEPKSTIQPITYEFLSFFENLSCISLRQCRNEPLTKTVRVLESLEGLGCEEGKSVRRTGVRGF